MNTCQIQQTTKTLKFVPANNSNLKGSTEEIKKIVLVYDVVCLNRIPSLFFFCKQ